MPFFHRGAMLSSTPVKTVNSIDISQRHIFVRKKHFPVRQRKTNTAHLKRSTYVLNIYREYL